MNKIHENMYNYTIYLSYLLYAFAIFGITKYAPQYLDTLKNIIKIYVSLVLVIKFNPFTNKTNYLSDFDRRLIFSSGMFLLLSTSIISIIEHYISNILDINISNIVKTAPVSNMVSILSVI